MYAVIHAYLSLSFTAATASWCLVKRGNNSFPGHSNDAVLSFIFQVDTIVLLDDVAVLHNCCSTSVCLA